MTISSINSIFLSYWCKRGFIYVWVEALCTMLDERELSQQSIVKTTHFFSFTEPFGRNTQFSVCFRNTLLFKWLRWFLVILHSEFDLTHCRWACFAMRNMPDRKTIPSQRWLGLASFATRYMPNAPVTTPHPSSQTPKPPSISPENPTQVFHQKSQHARLAVPTERMMDFN